MPPGVQRDKTSMDSGGAEALRIGGVRTGYAAIPKS